MDELSTIETIWKKNTGKLPNQEEYTAMEEISKFHIQAALKEAAEKAKIEWTIPMSYFPELKPTFERVPIIEKNSILNSYPLTNIK